MTRAVPRRIQIALSVAAIVAAGVGAARTGASEAVDEAVRQALDQAPSDAEVLFVVPDMAAFNQQLNALNRDLGLNRPELEGLLSAVKRTTGLTAGMSDAGPMVLVGMFREPEGADATLDTVVLVHTTDFAAMARPLSGGKEPAESGAELTLATGHHAYGQRRGDFAVIAPSAEALAAFKPGAGAEAILKQLGPTGRACLARSSATVIVHGQHKARALQLLGGAVSNVRQAAPAAPTEATDTARPGEPAAGFPGAQGLPGMPGLGGGIDIGGLVGSAVSQAIPGAGDTDLAENPFVRDADAMALGMDMTEDGLGLSAAIHFRPDTPLGKSWGDGGGAADLLARLPDLPYMGAFTISFEGMKLEQMGDAALLVVGMAGQAEWVEQAIVAAQRTSQPVKGLTQVMYVPTSAGLLTSPTATIKIVSTDKPAQFVKTLRATLERAGQDAPAADGASSTSYRPEELDLDEHRGDQYVISRQDMPVDTAALGQAGAMLAGIGGLATQTSGYVIVTDKHVVITETTDTTLLRQVLKTLDQETGLGTRATLAQARAKVFANAAAEMYVDLGAIMDSQLGRMISMLLGQLPQAPVDMLPVALGVEVVDGGIGARTYLHPTTMGFIRANIEHVVQRQAPAPGRAPDGGRRPGGLMPGMPGVLPQLPRHMTPPGQVPVPRGPLVY